MMDHKRVTCAVMIRGGRVLLARRSQGQKNAGLWEFPGGKIEENETPEEALKREIREELDTEISVGDLIDTVEYDYPEFHLNMKCYWAKVVKGGLLLKEHEAAMWLDLYELYSVEWLPSDLSLLTTIERIIQEK